MEFSNYRQLIEKLKVKLTKNMQSTIEKTLEYLGLKAINWARDNGNYTDRTSNLRNSIGMALCINKKITDFVLPSGLVETKQMSVEDIRTSIEDLVENISREVPEGMFVIVFAGMYYGIFVEAKGYTVLTGAEKQFDLQQIQKALQTAIKEL